jgi:Mrp family chromosome partitioning ATPase
VLICVCSAKGGAGATVVVAALAAELARRGEEVLLVDLGGDLPAVLGLPEPAVGLGDWLDAGPDAPVGALGRLEVDAGVDGVRLLPLGPRRRWPADRGAALVALVGVEHRTVLVDGGLGDGASESLVALRDALRERAATSLLVTRPCYLALRRAIRDEHRPDGIVLVREPGRALDRVDVERILHAPVVAQLDVDPAVARLVDAGLLASKAPRSLTKPLRRVA